MKQNMTVVGRLGHAHHLQESKYFGVMVSADKATFTLVLIMVHILLLFVAGLRSVELTSFFELWGKESPRPTALPERSPDP
jgi:hypothetical protein